MTTLLALLPDAGHDQQWLLLAAERMLHTPAPHLEPYGPTVFESNPPLAIWLSAIVVLLARLLHLSLTVTLKTVVILAAAGSATVSGRLLRRAHPDLSATSLWQLGIAFTFIFGAVPVRDFGQRDHILTLLILPYLIGATTWVPHVLRPLTAPNMGLLTRERILITLIAAVGIALKPHQALIPIAVELFLLLGGRLRLLEPLVFIASGVAYLAAIRLFASTYLTTVLPIVRDTYSAFGSLTLPQLASAAIGLLILAAIAFAVYAIKPKANPLVPILLTAGTAATLAYALQGTGWYYQQLPAISLFCLALYLGAPCLASETWAAKATWAKMTIPAAALTILALTLTTSYSDFHLISSQPFPADIQQPQPIPDPSFFANLPPEAAVATLTTSVDDTVPPAFRYHLTLAQRYPHLWMLPAILRNESGPKPRHPIPPARLAELDRLQHRFMVEDLTRWRPILILVERCQDPTVRCQVLEDRHDNLLAWFLRDPQFAAIFAHYRFLRSAGPYDAYVDGSGIRDQGLTEP